jgi:hypothetical protein
MSGSVEVVVDQPMGTRMRQQIARLTALAGDFQVRDAFPGGGKSFTFSLHSSSRRSAWNSSVDGMARSRLLLMESSRGASSSLRAW